MTSASSPCLAGSGPSNAWAGRAQWCVLQLGFGAGVHFLATCAAWRADAYRPRVLHVVACDTHPPTAADVLRATAGDATLQPLAEQLAEQCWGLLPGVHRLSLEHGRVLLTLCLGAPQALLRQQQPVADAVELDGAALEEGAHALHTLKAVARCCRRGTRLLVRDAPAALPGLLAGTGFALQAACSDDAPTCAEVRATFDPPWQPRAGRPPLPPAALPDGTTPGNCLVIGAGLAGSAVAASLARRGWRVTVLDAATQPAAGASGLPAGLFAPHVSPDDSLLSRLSRAGVRTTLQALAQLLPDTRGTDWDAGGVLEHDADALVRLAWRDGPGLDWSRPATAQQRARSHLPPDAHACWHERGGWVRPAALVRALLDAPGIRFRGGAAVERLVRQGGAWHALDATGTLLAEGTLAVVCAGPASARVAGVPLPLQWLRGQIAWGLHVHAPQGAPWPPQPVNGSGNLVPDVPIGAADGAPGWVLGATFERDCGALPVNAADVLAGRREIRDKLQVLQPALARALAPAFAAGRHKNAALRTWAGVRCAAPDRLPIVGPLDAQALPGLWASTAMGARGITLALLCGELLAVRLHAEPLPLEARLAQALAAERWAHGPHRPH